MKTFKTQKLVNSGGVVTNDGHLSTNYISHRLW